MYINPLIPQSLNSLIPQFPNYLTLHTFCELTDYEASKILLVRFS